MKNINQMHQIFSTVASIIVCSLITTFAYAKSDNDFHFTIINHFDQTLKFHVNINPNTLPDLPVTFSLNPQGSIATRVLPQNEAYIQVKGNKDDSAFFGVDIEKNHVFIHGYLSHGIAYSWVNNIVTFCTPAEYKKHHSCSI